MEKERICKAAPAAAGLAIEVPCFEVCSHDSPPPVASGPGREEGVSVNIRGGIISKNRQCTSVPGSAQKLGTCGYLFVPRDLPCVTFLREKLGTQPLLHRLRTQGARRNDGTEKCSRNFARHGGMLSYFVTTFTRLRTQQEPSLHG